MEKILTFIVNDNKILLLHGRNTDPQFHKSFWYVVTGAKEREDYNLEDTVKREVKEETNLEVLKIVDLKWTFNYKSLENDCIEHAYISYVKDNSIKLNEENYEYQWCNFDEFMTKIKWFYDKKELNEKIRKYIK